MDPITIGLIIGAGLGLTKALTYDAPKANAHRKRNSIATRYSPWTGLKATEVKEADPFGSMLAFGSAGAGIGGGMSQAGLIEAQTDWLNKGQSPWGFGAMMANPAYNMASTNMQGTSLGAMGGAPLGPVKLTPASSPYGFASPGYYDADPEDYYRKFGIQR